MTEQWEHGEIEREPNAGQWDETLTPPEATPTEQRAAGSEVIVPSIRDTVQESLPENVGLTQEQIGSIDPYVIYQQKAEIANTEAVGFDGPRRWKGDEWGSYDVDDWLRAYSRLQQQTADTISQSQMIQSTYKDNGLPADWDYAATETGPWGDALPEGAIGWTPYGQPDYGPGVWNWLKKQWGKITDVKTREERIDEIPEQYIGGENYTANAKKLWDEGKYWEWTKFKLGGALTAAKWGLETLTESDNSIVRYTSGIVSHIVLGGALEIANQAAIGIERLLGPALLSSADMIDREVAEGSVYWMEVIDKIPVVRELSRIVLGHAIAAGTKGGLAEIASLHRDYRQMEDTDWSVMGSRVAYSLATDQLLRENYKQRIQQGEDPRLLSMELELPGVEMGSRIFLDPLNALGAIGYVAKARKLERLGKAIHLTAIDGLATISDDIADIVRSGSAAAVGPKATALVDNVQDAISGVRNGALDLGSKRGIRVLTASGKRAITGRRIGDHLNVLHGHFADNADGFFQYLEGLTLVASDDAADVLLGMQSLFDSGAPLNMAFSQAGTETAVFMREILYDAATGNLRSAKTLLSGLDEGADFITATASKLDDALERVFPTIHEQIAQNDELVKLIDDFGETSDEVVEYLAKNPQAGKATSQPQRIMARADLNMQKYFYGPVVKAQSFVYMRMNPAYAMRNRWTNAFHVLVDEGPGAAYKSFFSGGKAVDEIGDLLGFIPSSATRGIGPRGGVRGLENAFESGDFWNWSKKSQQYEQMASAQVYSKSVRESMRKGLQEGVAIPNRSMLTGLTDEEADLYVAIAKRNNGNVTKIKEEIRLLAGDEGYNAAKNLTFLDDDQIKALKDLRLHDEVMRIGLEANNLDEADELVDALKAKYADEASGAAREAAVLGEPRNATEAAEVADNLALEEGLAEAGGKADDAADLMARQILADREMLASQELILAEMEQDLLLDVYSQGQMDKAAGRLTEEQLRASSKAMVDEVVAPIRSQTRQITDDAVRSADNLRGGVLSAKNKSFGIGRRPRGPERDVLFAKVWGETGLPSRPAEFFTDMTPKKFRRQMWEEYFPARNTVWVTRREQIFAMNNALMNQMGATLGRTPEKMAELLNRTYRKAATARMFGSAELLDDGTAVLKMSGSELRETLLQSHADLIGLNAAADASAVGRLEVQAANFDSLIERLSTRPDMTIEHAYGYLDDQSRQALAAIAGDDIAKQHEALSLILHDSKYRIIEDGGDVMRITGPNVEDITYLKPTPDRPAVAMMRRVTEPGMGTGEETARYWLDDLLRKGETRFYSSPQTDEGAGFWAAMEERGLVTRVGEVENPALVDRPYIEYTINPEGVGPVGENVFTQELVAPDPEGFLYTPARNAYETQPAAVEQLEKVRQGLHDNWGDLRKVTPTQEKEQATQAWLGEMNNRVTELKATSVEVANQTRDFILLDYEARTGLDNALSYIYPYHFWYKGTYKNWMQRVRYNPALINRYAQYRQVLEKKHAGMPDWWKYNINIQEDLLGIETDSPLWFNLESSLNPMNGLTGIDFNDPRKRLDWYSSTVDDLGKFGPTVWTPYALALAVRYNIQGKDDAAARWAGRLTPLTRTLRDTTALLGMNEGEGIEIDPLVNFFSGGVDPYERARVGRMLSAMVDEGKYPEAAIVDAAYSQDGPIWQEAFTRSIHQRAPNALSIAAPFFLGTGFKPRTETDAEIDRMYSEMYGHMGNKANLSPDDYREGWDAIRQKYPFMDVLLMSRKTGDERDEALAWNVLDRIPPGMTDEIAEMVNIKSDDIGNFYDSKGDLSSMKDSDRMRFMAAVIDIGALLDLPDAPTQAEWDNASSTYKAMLTEGENLFGDDVWDRVDVFYGKEDDDKDAYLKANPVVEQALDWKQATVIGNPVLSPYYTSIARVESYLKSQMYDAIEDELGERIWDEWEVYHRLKDMNSADARHYWKANPQLERYGEIKDEMEPLIAENLLRIGLMIPEAKPPNWRGAAPDAGFRVTNNESEAWIRSQILEYSSGREPVEQPQAPPPDFSNLPPTLRRLLADMAQGEELPDVAKRLLETFGYTEEFLSQFIQ